jgi:UDP-glucose 4-epimerase
MADRVLVTGGAGFIGSHVCEAYRDAGWEVVAVDDLSTGRRANVPEGVEFREMDIRSEVLAELLETGGFRVVNHHAAQIDVRVSVRDPRRDASVNVDGFLNVLESARAGGVQRLIFVSSGGVVYGEPEELPVEETREKDPLSPYGVTKLAGELYLHSYRRVHGLEYVALRYSNVYGPRQDPHGEAGVVAIFSRQLLRGEPLMIYGDGEQTRDYVYVKDVARANLLATTLDPGEGDALDDRAYNVGTGVETSVNELADVLESAAGVEAERIHAAPRPGELRRNALDASRLREAGWEPEVSLRQGLAATFASIAGKEEGE